MTAEAAFRLRKTQIFCIPDGLNPFRIISRSIFISGKSLYQPIESHNILFTGISDDFNLFFITRFKTYSCCCRNIQVTTESFCPVEFEIPVHFEEMEMRTDLNRTITRIVDNNLCCIPTFVVFDRLCTQNLSSDSHMLFRSKTRYNGCLFRSTCLIHICHNLTI